MILGVSGYLRGFGFFGCVTVGLGALGEVVVLYRVIEFGVVWFALSCVLWILGWALLCVFGCLAFMV